MEPLPVGLLALQGDFAEHGEVLRAAGLPTREVRRPEQLIGLSGIVLPGGESSTMWKLLELQDLREPLRNAIVAGLPTLATCAGMILLAKEVVEPAQGSYGLLDIAVARNGYGRQIHSGRVALRATAIEVDDPHGVFIRAPRVLQAGDEAEVLAWRNDDPVLIRQNNILAAAFHPELERGHFVTEMFVASLERQWIAPAMMPGTTSAGAAVQAIAPAVRRPVGSSSPAPETR